MPAENKQQPFSLLRALTGYKSQDHHTQLCNFSSLQGHENWNLFSTTTVPEKQAQNYSQPSSWVPSLPKRRSKSWLRRLLKEQLPRVSSFDRARAQISVLWTTSPCASTHLLKFTSVPTFKVWNVSESVSCPLRWKLLQQGESQWYYLLLTSYSQQW